MVLTMLAYFVAITLSFAAGLISIFGMAAIFSGAYTVTLIIMGLLELAKVVVATWLHRHWNELTRKFRFFFSLAVLILMGFTSLGIYGFFTRAHIIQQVALETGEITKVPAIQAQVQALEQKRDIVQQQLNSTMKAVDTVIGVSKNSKNAKEAVKINKSSKEDQDKLIQDLSSIIDQIGTKNSEIKAIEGRQKALEVEIGPLKYLAKFWYGREPTADEGERVINWLIFAIMLVFDPLALTLLIAANKINDSKKVEEPKVEEPEVILPEPELEDEVVLFPRRAARKRGRRKKGNFNPTALLDPVPPRRPRRRKGQVLDLSNFKF